MAAANGTLMFLVQMPVRERKARIALANFATTYRDFGPANVEGWVRTRKIFSIVIKCLETLRMLAFRIGQEVFGSELSYQRTVECSLIFFFW